MSDIEYVIGAKDQATAPINKVDSALEKLEKQTKDVGDTSERSFGKIGISMGSMAKVAGVIGLASLAVSGFKAAWGGITSGISGAMDDFDRATESLRALDQSMELNGGSSESLIDSHGAVADSLEKLANVEAETTLELMKSAAMLGVQNDQLDDAAKTAIGLSEAMGISLEDGMQKARLATEGNFDSFNKLIPSMKSLTTNEAKLAAVSELAAKGLAMKEAASHSAQGEMERASNAVGNLAEQFGAILSPIREFAAKGITLLADALSNMLGPAIESSGDLFEQWEPVILAAIEKTVNGIIAGLTMAEVVYNNFGKVVEYAIDYVLLAYETYRADTEHLFVTVLPTYISWFGENFFNIIETAFSAVTTVISNHIEKIADSFTAFWDFIASGGQSDLLGQLGDIAGRSYLDGFESTIQALPEIAARGLTAREKELNAAMGAIGTDLGNEFSEKFAERSVSFSKDMESELGKLTDGLDLNIKDGVKDKSDALLQAQEGRLLTRGPAEKQENYMKRIADATEQTAKKVAAVESAQMAAASELADIKNGLADAPNINLAPTP